MQVHAKLIGSLEPGIRFHRKSVTTSVHQKECVSPISNDDDGNQDG